MTDKYYEAQDYLKRRADALAVAELRASPEWKEWKEAQKEARRICGLIVPAYDNREEQPLNLQRAMEQCDKATAYALSCRPNPYKLLNEACRDAIFRND